MNVESKSSITETFIGIAPILSSFFDEPVSIAITDCERFLFNQSSPELPIKSEVGKAIPEGGGAYIALQSGKPGVKEVPEHVYGTAFKSYAVPLKDETGTVVGCVMLAKSMEKGQRVRKNVDELSSKLESIVTTVDGISQGIRFSSQNVNEISKAMTLAMEQVEAMNEILNFIQKIAGTSKMMGINASIEAARVGEAGRGFAVVAKEIEKMAVTTAESAKSIRVNVETIRSMMKEINAKTQETTEVFLNQAEEMERMAVKIQQSSENAKSLELDAKNL